MIERTSLMSGMPFIAFGVLLVNLFAIVVAWLIPDWSALGTGYEVELRRR